VLWPILHYRLDLAEFFLCSERAANCVELVMLARCILTTMGISAAISAAAAELRPEEAKYFIAGKYFSYRCFVETADDDSVGVNPRLGR
jgi:hypothetical protein